MVAMVVALMVAAAPAWCLCAPLQPIQAPRHCCAKPMPAERQSGGSTCVHCGQGLVKATAEHSPTVDLSPSLWVDIAIVMDAVAVGLSPCGASDATPPPEKTPVSLHYISLT